MHANAYKENEELKDANSLSSITRLLGMEQMALCTHWQHEHDCRYGTATCRHGARCGDASKIVKEACRQGLDGIAAQSPVRQSQSHNVAQFIRRTAMQPCMLWLYLDASCIQSLKRCQVGEDGCVQYIQGHVVQVPVQHHSASNDACSLALLAAQHTGLSVQLAH